MPPHLRNGIPVDQRLPQTPKPLHLCTCWQCYQQTAINPTTFQVEQGAYVSWNTHKRHLKEDGARGIAPASAPSPAHLTGKLDIPVEQPPLRSVPTNLGHIIDDICTKLPGMRSQAIDHKRLVFVTPPTPTSLPTVFQGFSTRDTTQINSGTYALDYSAPENRDLLIYEGWLTESLQHIERGGTSPDVNLTLKSAIAGKQVEDALEEVENTKAAVWERQRVLLSKGDEDHDFSLRSTVPPSDLRDMEPFISIPLLLVAAAHLLCHLSIDHCSFILACLRATIVATAQAAVPMASLFDPTSLSKSIPSDVRTVIGRLDLTPTTRSFVCCPKCFTCHPLADDVSYPERCTHQETPSSSCCNHPLRKTKLIKGHQKTFPVRRFLVQSIEDWTARLLNQPEFEMHMDEYPIARETSGNVDDIWDAKALRDLKGPDGKPFIIKGGKEGRYVFSICFDGLNYDGNKHGGRKASVCAVYLVCLNLPPRLRYKVQNLFLAAVIPGPGEPSLHQINHVLTPLVDDLLRLYIDGAIVQTPKHLDGRLIRIALGPLVADLIAARQMAGFSSHSSKTFCPHCSLILDEISNMDKSTWGTRDPDCLRAQAEAWRDASSEAVRDNLWKANGVRWTELQRLPYWEPSKFMTIDPMHLLYLGILQRHCRKVWGMDDKLTDGAGVTHDQLIDPSQSLADKRSPEAVMDALKFGTATEVASFNVSALKQVCSDLGLPFGGKKKALVNALKEFRTARNWPVTRDVPPATVPTLGQVIHSQRPDQRITDEDGMLVDATIPLDPSTQALRLFDGGGDISLMEKPDLAVIAEGRLVRFSAQELEGMDEMTLREKLEALRAQRRNNLLVERNRKETVAAGSIITAPSSSSKDLETLKKDAIVAFLVSQYGSSDRERLDEMTKRALIGEVKEWRRENLAIREQKKTRVLGRQMLGQLWLDMEKTHLPSWITPLPKNVGSAQAGSLGADEWRTLCLVHLPITLIRLWGNNTSSKEFQMLRNFMDLVTAVKLASMRTTNANRIRSYEFHMQRYLSQLLALYPGATITPNHHLSLHLPEVLDDFGPSHVFRAFVFERGNLILQQTPTNNKIDELTPTLMTRFCQKQRLKTLFDGLGPSEVLSSVVQKFNHVFNSDLRGTVNEFLLGSDQSPSLQTLQQQMTPLSDEISHLLEDWKRSTTSRVRESFARAAFLPVSTVRNLRVTTWRTSLGDSHVAFHKRDGTWSAGRVREIFVHLWRKEGSLQRKVFLLVDVFSELSPGDAPNDPYRKFSIAGGRMFLERFSGSGVISDEEVWCHFARYDQHLPGTSTPCITVIPLDKE